jgi:hypothetical protein
MNFRDLNITVPGAGDSTAVANAIPKALGDHINAHIASQKRRGATP